MIDQGTVWVGNDRRVSYLRCKNCNWVSPIDTHYILKVCDCYDADMFEVDYSEISYVDSEGMNQYGRTYTGPSYIGVDGGREYCRYIGEPDQMEFLNRNKEVVYE